jgi:hypothetical protein
MIVYTQLDLRNKILTEMKRILFHYLLDFISHVDLIILFDHVCIKHRCIQQFQGKEWKFQGMRWKGCERNAQSI